ncbi:hypothetical protein BH09PSE2_BH09PSE2_16950 [soil metagenome]
MTFAALLALALLQTAPPATAPVAPQTPAPAPVSTTVSGVEVTAAPDPVQTATELADLYDKSCGGRIYGTYADACNGLADQLRKAQAAARKAKAAKPQR